MEKCTIGGGDSSMKCFVQNCATAAADLVHDFIKWKERETDRERERAAAAATCGMLFMSLNKAVLSGYSEL
jgi:hypothetical protein